MKKQGKRWYAVQTGDEYACDNGSTIKRKAVVMAHAEARNHPCKEVRIVLCRTDPDDDFCEGVIIIQEGNTD